MTKHLRNDIDKLEQRLLFLAGRVEDAVRLATMAFVERRADLASQVIEGDAIIDREEVEIEEDCLKILALHQPVATDLRFIAACLKINSDLERIGDLALSIAARTMLIIEARGVAMPKTLSLMSDAATEMVRRALDSLVRQDAEGARRVLAQDEVVDGMYKAVLNEIIQSAGAIEHVLPVISISKNLERIADHATNIAEDVVYLVEGEIIRHLPGEMNQPIDA